MRKRRSATFSFLVIAGLVTSVFHFLDGNGTFDTTLNGQSFPVNGDYGNSFMKVATSPQLAVADYFAMYNTVRFTT